MKLSKEEKKLKKLAGSKIQSRVHQFANKMKRRPTKHERLLKLALYEKEIDFYFQRHFYSAEKGYIADFYFVNAMGSKFIIEVDGASHLSKRQKEYDRERTDWFKKKNCEVIRFTNDQIENEMDYVMEVILLMNPTFGGYREYLKEQLIKELTGESIPAEFSLSWIQ